jgi:hypothetical protein
MGIKFVADQIATARAYSEHSLTAGSVIADSLKQTRAQAKSADSPKGLEQPQA